MGVYTSDGIVVGLSSRGSTIKDRPFLPSDLSDLAVWFDVDSLDLANGARVTSWPARAGGVTLTAAGDARPTFATNWSNGKPAVTFDGVANVMTAADVSLDGFSTAFVVCGKAGGGNLGALISHGGDVIAAEPGMAFGNSPQSYPLIVSREIGSASVENGASDWLSGTVQVAGYFNDAGDVFVLRQDGDNVTGNSPTPGSGDDALVATFRVGSGFNDTDFTDMNIAEILVFNRPLTTEERALVIGYLTHKYGI
jgi:hypothetical protein